MQVNPGFVCDLSRRLCTHFWLQPHFGSASCVRKTVFQDVTSARVTCMRARIHVEVDGKVCEVACADCASCGVSDGKQGQPVCQAAASVVGKPCNRASRTDCLENGGRPGSVQVARIWSDLVVCPSKKEAFGFCFWMGFQAISDDRHDGFTPHYFTEGLR